MMTRVVWETRGRRKGKEGTREAIFVRRRSVALCLCVAEHVKIRQIPFLQPAQGKSKGDLEIIYVGAAALVCHWSIYPNPHNIKNENHEDLDRPL